MSAPSSDFGYTAWLVDLLRRIGDVERAKLVGHPELAHYCVTGRTLSDTDERQIVEIVNRTCAALRSGAGFTHSEEEQAPSEDPSQVGQLLAALHRNGRKVDPEVLRKLEAHRQRIREQKR